MKARQRESFIHGALAFCQGYTIRLQFVSTLPFISLLSILPNFEQVTLQNSFLYQFDRPLNVLLVYNEQIKFILFFMERKLNYVVDLYSLLSQIILPKMLARH